MKKLIANFINLLQKAYFQTVWIFFKFSFLSLMKVDINRNYLLKQVKNYILFSAISLLTFTSCKKDNADIDLGTISVSIDGKQTTFNFGAKATTTSVTGGYGITIKGNKKDPAASQTNISFSITSPSPIVAKTYVENGGGNPLIQMEYFMTSF